MNTLNLESFKVEVSNYIGVEPEELNETTHLYDDLGIDSLGIFSLGMYLTNTYEVKVPLSEVAGIQNIKDLYELICKFY
ncbi:acyl carrier protein [Cellulosilyticum ruminicola]|uniref:acyl carrier protein n=1 Tax=Cellulosilyticum ruminicola TaxID=425254 RepID=UPI0006D27E05|nr:acyl carrier protein [Cellulosilyticum ruminicola]